MHEVSGPPQHDGDCLRCRSCYLSTNVQTTTEGAVGHGPGQ